MTTPTPGAHLRTLACMLALLGFGCSGDDEPHMGAGDRQTADDSRSSSDDDDRDGARDRDDDANGSDANNADPDALPIVEPPPIHVAANDAVALAPMDATPSPDGEEVYFTGLSPAAAGDPEPAIFHVAADGGEPELLAMGAPLVAPVGIATSLDGERLLVADAATEGGGGLLSLSSRGDGAPQLIAGTGGYAPQGVVVAEIDGEERVYFSGRGADDGVPGVFQVSTAGGAVTRVAGEPLVDPGGVAVAADGTVYVVDALGAGPGAAVYRVREGAAERLFDQPIGVGFPAGLTLDLQEATLIVSGIDPVSRRDRVYFVDVATGSLAVMVEPVGAFRESAGLHRAHDANVFAWADSEANATGTVYVLKP